MVEIKDSKKDKLSVREHVVRCRLNSYEYQIFELLMKLRDQSHSDILRSALLNELNKPIYEPLNIEQQQAKNWLSNYVFKIKRPKQKIKVINKFQRIDPELLVELNAIGNNLNQIARALNILKQEDNGLENRVNFDYLQCLFILENISNEITQTLNKVHLQKPNKGKYREEIEEEKENKEKERKEKRVKHLVKTIEQAR
ncbi:plasmid mobilization relaxosome protein MobC [Acinetobacter nectaris]|uniref:plasmid mobilization relaxosome protein MobC n=1 Tax=Acinetobacter nectaris TaxID=1219382 RepID=UPI001F16D475|nr:plasmid mobilization relaxosome protein MobC [Acinetobacter nectaris]MCF9000282.1 plasmid mobilization relaxosome protein MobC [Acinetobacter nectaris]MCF9028538.1 plasmid mobilization relaxosome protein MobC [Acinetobacter nectaris]